MQTKHGVRPRKTWRKLHLAVSEDGEILASELTTLYKDDTSQVPKLLGAIDNPINEFISDGGYKASVVESYLAGSSTKVLIPPYKNHRISKKKSEFQKESIQYIRKKGLYAWKTKHQYGRKEIVEGTISRYKSFFSGRLLSRDFERQRSETKIAVKLLNKFRNLNINNQKTVA